MSRYDPLSSLVWFSLALFICIESSRLPLGSFRDPGPGFWPLGAGIILGLLSAINYGQSRLGKSEQVLETWYSKDRWKKLILILVSLLGYAICLEIFGFLTSTFLLLVFLFRCIEPQKWIWVTGGSAIASFTSYAVFELWLKVQLPKGIWGF